MIKRTPSVDRICAAAVTHFAERGYDASSLNEIAEAVGIRKASLYAHFENKDALYMAVFSDALNAERDYARRCFVSEGQDELPGSHYCTRMADRYAESVYLRFLLRSAYLPPRGLHTQISAGYEAYLEQLQYDFISRLSGREACGTLKHPDPVLLGEAFLGIIDGLHVELLYGGGRRFTSRLTAFLLLLENAVAGERDTGGK